MTQARLTRALAWLGLVVSLTGILALLLSGPLTRIGLWDFRTGFTVLKWAAFVGIAGAVIAVITVLLHLKTPVSGVPWRAGVSLALAAIVVGVPWYWLQYAKSVPPIHDITTDFVDPPQFEAVLALRAGAPNDAVYGGPEIAQRQQKAYPGIHTLIFTKPPGQVFSQALVVAKEMGWKIVAAKKDEGRIEATDTTTWFGFKDDVTIRIEPAQSGTAVDIRSVSRVGQGDVGTNAARIRDFSTELTQRLRS